LLKTLDLHAIALGLSEKGGNSYVLGSVAVAFFFVFFAVSQATRIGRSDSLMFGTGIRLRCPQCTLAVPDGDQCSRDEDKGRESCYGDELDLCKYIADHVSRNVLLTYVLELRCRPSNPPRHRGPRLQVLDHLGRDLFCLHTHQVPLLSGDCKPGA